LDWDYRDDAIVVIENTHRILRREGKDFICDCCGRPLKYLFPYSPERFTTLAPFFLSYSGGADW
jgi:hypothetical protein